MPYRILRPDGLFVEYKKTPQEIQIEKVEKENKELRKELDSIKSVVEGLMNINK